MLLLIAAYITTKEKYVHTHGKQFMNIHEQFHFSLTEDHLHYLFITSKHYKTDDIQVASHLFVAVTRIYILCFLIYIYQLLHIYVIITIFIATF